jgi:hypothetical protein
MPVRAMSMSDDPITLDEARQSFLAPWYSGDLVAGDCVSSPRDAAAAAIVAALNAEQRGIIRVVVSTPDQRNQVRKHLEAMTSVPELRRRVKRTPDSIAFSTGVTIVVDPNDVRHVTDALITITLTPGADSSVVVRSVVVAAGEELPVEAEGEELVVLRIVAPPDWPPDEPIVSEEVESGK